MLKRFLAAALLSSALIPAAFANTNAGSKLFISTTNRETDAAQADFEAMSWIEIKSMGNMGETGSNTNILNYNTWDTKVVQKAKGVTDAGSPTVELARLPFDAGQQACRTAAKTNLNYCFKVERNDAITVGGVGSRFYYRGLVTGPTRPNGGVEDFDLEVFTLALNQEELAVAPGAGGNAPTLTVAPAITGTATVGQVLTSNTGTFTGDATITYAYQWFAGGVAIAGATAGTYTLLAAQLGKIITVRVTATNASGSAQGYSAPTSAVA